MKKSIIYLSICSTLLLSCFEFKNVKIIVGDDTALGFELDLSDMELVCKLNPAPEKQPIVEPFAVGVTGDEKQHGLNIQEEVVVRP
ncbi:MAG: hypothetical protein IPM82_26650 [Saprospiraceae bacterium]|nr:hypothetical protein [Saprospiraceae bacterium]